MLGGPDRQKVIPEEYRTMPIRKGASLIETLVVIAIIGNLLALMLPAVQSARRRALETACKNNLHQINLGIAHYAEAHNRLPGPGVSGFVSGWTIDVLPFLDQKNLRDSITPGIPIPAAPSLLLKQPRILRCPVQSAGDGPTTNLMEPSSYVFVPNDRRDSFLLFDAPLEAKIPWASGPELTVDDVIRRTGPHNRGFFFANGFQHGVRFMLEGRTIQ